MTSAICVYDFTLPKVCEKDELKTVLKEISKKWCFQLERGESGYEHYQGRFSLKTKVRLSGCKNMFKWNEIHLSPTSNENKTNTFYVTKEETRIDGPWSDADKEIYIPRQIREIDTLYPWQQYIVDRYDVWDKRTINVVIDTKGNNGKSTLIGYMRAHGLAFAIPFANDFKDIMRMIMDVGTKRCYLMDMPRAINKEKLYQMYGAFETIKNGYAFDDRYHFKEKVFDCPNIWIFTNHKPDMSLLSEDRWVLWKISDDMDLISYETLNEEF